MSKKKNTLEEINGRLDIEQESSSKLEEIAIEFIQNETHRKKKKQLKRNVKRITELWGNFKKPNTYVIRILKEVREKHKIILNI